MLSDIGHDMDATVGNIERIDATLLGASRTFLYNDCNQTWLFQRQVQVSTLSLFHSRV
jgi:hypothetical protein